MTNTEYDREQLHNIMLFALIRVISYCNFLPELPKLSSTMASGIFMSVQLY